MEGSKGSFTLQTPDGPAKMTFSVMSPHRVIVDHTETPDAGRGKGYGRVLFDALVEDSRANGIKVIPLCPFVKMMSGKHPETADIFG